jgi:phenylacetate-CoA ligase
MKNLIENIKTKFYERVAYPVYQFKYGPKFGYEVIKILKHLKKTQWLSQDELSELQTKKFKRLIEHVYQNVPYYHEIMGKIGLRPEDVKSVENIKLFPILTKKRIRENFDRLLSKSMSKRKFITASTGGSTGKPLSFIRDWNTLIWTEATTIRGKSWAGFRIGNREIDFRSMGIPSLLGKVRGRAICRYDFPALAKGEELIKYLKQIKSLKPFCITAYASNLYRLAKYCHKYKRNDIEFPVIFSTGEMLYDYQREFLGEQFKSKVFDYYGCGEISSLAYECEYHHKHISDEHLILETIDSKGDQIIDRLGEVIITDLNNYTMPFIRYKNGDVGVVTEKTCKCGRGLRVLKSIEGRAQDFLVKSDGGYIPPAFFPGCFKSLRGIDQYQIVQTDFHNIILKIVKNQFFLPKELEYMLYKIKEKIGDAVNVDVQNCNYISSKVPDKTRLVLSHLTVEF